VIAIDNPKASVLGTPEGMAQYRHALDLLTELGGEYVKKFLKIRGLVGIHNLIKTLILVRLYQGDEKSAAIKMLQEAEMERGEYTIIEIIMPRFQHFDYAALENMLTAREIRSGLADELYEELNQPTDIRTMTVDEKLDALMHSGVLVPIVEDMLLYHKDTERYESGSTTAVTSDGKRSRSEDTRLRYIVAKLDAASELHSAATRSNPQRREQIEKMMYVPMRERRAVLINELEEIKIMNKVENQGKQSENIEFYHDLQQYRSYPYVSFKALSRQGFAYRPAVETVLAVRSTNFEFSRTSQMLLETRSASNLMSVNVVGFLIRPLGEPVGCQRVGDVIDVRKFTMKSRRTGRVFQTDNGYLGALRYIRSAIAKGRQDSPAICWMLDIEKDKFDLKGYEPISSDNMQDYMRLMLAHVYDSVEEMLTMRIAEDLQKLRDAGEIFSVTEVRRYIQEAEFRTMPLSPLARQRLAMLAFTEMYPPGSSAYDSREDIYPGFDTELQPNLVLDAGAGGAVPEVSLVFTDPDAAEVVPEEQAAKTTKMSDVALDEEVPDMSNPEISARLIEHISENRDYQHAICEHILIWQETMLFQRNRETAAYEESLYNFLQTFVRESEEEEYVCKSCDEILPIKRFVVDGVYDDEQQRFITFAIPMDTPLEESREYEKYTKIIKNIDRRLERICDMLNLKFYVGSSNSAKWRRRTVVKNVLDLLLAHNRSLKNSYKRRKDTLDAQYGIDRNLSNLFIFEIDDSVFDYSSRDRDFYRLIKLNNITSYILFALLLELDEEQITTLGRDRRAKIDKICNIELYERVAPEIFSKIRVIRNLQGDRIPISQIPNFGYTLFITSCILARNRTWFVESDDAVDKRVFNPSVQKSILHTTVDLINSVLEVYMQPERDRTWVYGILGGRFMSRLKTLYESPILERRIAALASQDATGALAKLKKAVVPKREIDTVIIKPTGLYTYETVTTNTPQLEKRIKLGGYIAARGEPQRIGYLHERREYDMERDTNCPDGQFHKWANEGNSFRCKLCNQTMSDVTGVGELTEDDEMRLLDMVWDNTLVHMAESICTNGSKHNFETREHGFVCERCGLVSGSKPSMKAAKQIASIVSSIRILEPKHDTGELMGISEHVKRTLAKLVTDAPVNELTSAIEAVLGKDARLPDDQSMYDDSYIAEYDYHGNRLAKPIVISSREGKLHYRQTHPHFKSSVLYYTDKNKEVDVYYDAITHAYIGFRERNREYVNAESPHYLKVRWSLKTELELLGFSGMNMRIDRLRAELGMLESELVEPGGFESMMSSIYRQRLHRISQSVGEIVRIIYRIHHGHTMSDEQFEELRASNTESMDGSIVIAHEFSKSLANINIGNGDNRVFAEWESIMRAIPNEAPPAGEKPDEWLAASDLAKDDRSGKMAIHYISSQLAHLMKLNGDKFTAVNLINLVARVINYVFNRWNADAMEHEYELKRFMMRLDMKRAYEAAHEVATAEAEEVVVDSTGEGVITDYIEEDHVTDPVEADEMFNMADIEGGAEMEAEGSFISDFRPDEIAD
jgi:hypothetical protein